MYFMVECVMTRVHMESHITLVCVLCDLLVFVVVRGCTARVH